MQNIAHPSGLKEPCIVLISDPEDKQEKMEHPKFENFEEQSVEISCLGESTVKAIVYDKNSKTLSCGLSKRKLVHSGLL